MSYPDQAAKVIQQAAPNFKPRIGMVMGSGLNELMNDLEDTITISYKDLPGFPELSVKGHSGQLILGKLNGVEIACLQGRAHTYESGSYEPVKNYVRTLKRIGCEYFFATNASGSLHAEVGPGELIAIKDHINFQFWNPLIGPNDDDFGPRFPAMDNAYNQDMRSLLQQCANDLDIKLHEGVYMSVFGPCYETVAEIKAFRTLGADLVGMSTVPEVIVAHHCGMKVAVVATITNYATGLTDTSHEHSSVVAMAQKASVKLRQLVKEFVTKIS